MAENYLSVTFLGSFGNSLYFKDDESEYCSDALKCSHTKTGHLSHRSTNKYLTLNHEGQFEFETLTSAELDLPESNFNISVFHDSSMEQRNDISVMLYGNHNGKKMVVCCSQNYEIQPKEMKDVNEAEPHALFYMTKVSSSTYMFESSVHHGRFLAFEDKTDMLKLVLCEKDEVDERREIKYEKSDAL